MRVTLKPIKANKSDAHFVQAELYLGDSSQPAAVLHLGWFSKIPDTYHRLGRGETVELKLSELTTTRTDGEP